MNHNRGPGGYFRRDLSVPDSVNVSGFCDSRMEEVHMLTQALNESPFRGQTFQRLPKHMRRRQMSHHKKRLPKAQRHTAMMNEDANASTAPKRPSRKFRRRADNLLEEYNRRQRDSVWLETHIWHAKKFHMIEKWGYKLPMRLCDKGFRACYRAITNHCFLSDISYMNCIELIGSESQLLNGLQKCVSPDCGLTFAANMYINGCREGSVTLFHPNAFPYDAIGSVSFIWKPVDGSSSRTIWIFTHPSFHHEVVDMLNSLFSLKQIFVKRDEVLPASEVKGSSGEMNKPFKAENVNKEEIKLETRNIPYDRTPKYKNDDGTISMCLLKDTLNRFRLIGPLSLPLISDAFQIDILLSHEISKNSEEIKLGKRGNVDSIDISHAGDSKKMKLEKGVKNIKGTDNSVWWRSYYDSELNRNNLEKQEDFYRGLKYYSNPADLPSRLVFSLVVRDPRLSIPDKRIKSRPHVLAVRQKPITDNDQFLCQSPLWNSEIRDQVTTKMKSTHEINAIRCKLSVPGSNVSSILYDDSHARIPLLVIHRTDMCTTGASSHRNGISTGFDIILPAGWAMPVWLSLVQRGARPGGLRELGMVLFESNNMSELFQPDSTAGEIDSQEKYAIQKNAYFKCPPTSRPSYKALGVVSPFYCPWKVLLGEWNADGRNPAQPVDKFYVLRDRNKLTELNELLKELRNKSRTKSQTTFTHSFTDFNCLVPVCFESTDRGLPHEFAMLCLPTADDMLHHEQKCSKPDQEEHDVKDGNTREEHKKVKELKMSKKKRKKKEIANQRKAIDPNMLEKRRAEINDVSITPIGDITSVMNSCSRTIMGFTVLGGYRFSKAHGAGLGYVTLRGLLRFLENCYLNEWKPIALYREANELQYRFCVVNICMN